MVKQDGIKVLSLFDGISVAQLALDKLDIHIEKYYASEINKKPIEVSSHHFPNTIHLGDVRNIDGRSLPKIDLLVCGSPCQDLSGLRANREGLKGDKSSLFYHALKLLDETKPKYFLFENVGSMSLKDKMLFDKLLGTHGVLINSNLVSAQNRSRIYWTNIPNVTQPRDRNILLADVLEKGFTDRAKANCVLTKGVSLTSNGVYRYLNKSIGNIVYGDKEFAEYSKSGKLFFLKELQESEIKRDFRLPTVTELERLQTLPDGYVGDVLKKTPAHHAIGNAFTLEVIMHFLSLAKF